jgi:Cap4 SAVED domain
LIAIAWSPFLCPQGFSTGLQIFRANDTASSFCPVFEFGSWRYKQLAEHLFDWLPDVALRPKEREAFLFEPNKTLARSCRRLFDTDDASKRGEVGEFLLHAACRQEYGTAPFVARLFYKMRTNDSVTGVDVLHVLMNENNELELWLGEAKLYDSVQAARYKALASVAAMGF